jgi:hypothetical protein
MRNAERELKHGGGWKAVAAEMKNQAKLGISMMKKKRMHFRFKKIKRLSEIKRLYKKARDEGDG